MKLKTFFLSLFIASVQLLTAAVPVVTSVTPNAGPTIGGIMPIVTINGSGFTGASTVQFGTLPALSFTVVDDSTITVASAAVPGQAASSVHVTVTNGSGASVPNNVDYYTYSDLLTGYFVHRRAGPFDPPGAGVVPVDLNTSTLGSAIVFANTLFPSGMVVTPDRQFGYVGCSIPGNNMQLITLATGAVTEIPLQEIETLDITPDGQFIYAVDSSGTMHSLRTSDNAIDTQPNFPLALVANFTTPRIAITTDGKLAYVTGVSGSDVQIINLATGTVVNTITLSDGPNPTAIVMSPDGTRAYVVGRSSSAMNVINTVTQTEITGPGYPIGMVNRSGGMTITPDGRFVYVANSGAFSPAVFSKIDTSTNTVTTLTLSGIAGTATTIQSSLDSKTVYAIVNGSPDNGAIPLDVATDTEGTPIISDLAAIVDFVIIANAPYPPPIPPTPPTPTKVHSPHKFRGTLKFHGKKIELSSRWKASSTSSVTAYRIYAGKKRIATIDSTSKLRFKKRLKPGSYFSRHIGAFKKHLFRKYRIRAVTADGASSNYRHLHVR